MENKIIEQKDSSINTKAFKGNLLFKYFEIPDKEIVIQNAESFSSALNFDEDFIFSQKETIHGKILETEWCNDGGYHYYEETTMYFSCKIDIKFCFMKRF
jgi:hypothetical protein